MRAVADLDTNTLRAVTDDWPQRLLECVASGGGHFEYILCYSNPNLILI